MEHEQICFNWSIIWMRKKITKETKISRQKIGIIKEMNEKLPEIEGTQTNAWSINTVFVRCCATSTDLWSSNLT